MNRNIITAADAERLRKNFVASLGDRAFGERMLGEPGVPTPPAPPSPDAWYQRLAKYIPAEALSLYLGLDRGLQSANIGNQGLVISLGVATTLKYRTVSWCLPGNLGCLFDFLIRSSQADRSRRSIEVQRVCQPRCLKKSASVFVVLRSRPAL